LRSFHLEYEDVITFVEARSDLNDLADKNSPGALSEYVSQPWERTMFYVYRAQTNTSRQSVMLLANSFVTLAATQPPFGKEAVMSQELLSQFTENADGLKVDLEEKSWNLMSRGVSWALVVDEQKNPCALCKYRKSDRGDVDLSEIVKHPQKSSDALCALFKWAYFFERNGDRNLTLTAATKKLIEIYESYGFQTGAIHPGMQMAIRSGTNFTKVNLLMTMGVPSAEVLGAQYRVIPT